MDNNKLGLKIVRINDGYTDLLEINGDQKWTKNVWDIRKNLENIDNLNGSSAVLMLISIDTGHILTIASLIEGRITDCISAWIHIPAAISVSGKELVELVESVKKEILANTRNDEKLRQLFSKEYELAPVTKMASGSVGEKCAYRYYGQKAKYTLAELLNDMYQSYYKNYKSIFLLDNSTNLRCTSGEDLSDQKVYSMMIVKSPGAFESFEPYIGGQPFVGQMYVVEGDIINIEWKRDNYLPIKTVCIAQSEIKYKYPKSDQYQKVIPYNIITVLDELNRNMQHYDLCINGQLIKKGESFIISENKLIRTKVKISANGYNDYEECIDLTNKRTINLTKKIYTYEFLLPIKNHNDYSIKIDYDVCIKTSPINGYESNNSILPLPDKNELHYQPFTKKHLVICLIIVALSLCVGICAGWFVKGFFTKSKIRELETEISLLKKEKPTQKNDNKSITKKESSKEDGKIKASEKKISAIEYLDNNEIWNRTEMEKFEDLKGLWDAMNERKFDDILKYRETLSSSKEFNNLVKCVENNKDKKGLGLYNTKTNDHDITIKRYINNLNNAKPDQNKGKSKDKENNVSENKNSQANW